MCMIASIEIYSAADILSSLLGAWRYYTEFVDYDFT